eukprot:gnl/TRDRNA2_/TRDRNA2_175328_c0_seq4.p1 gnl/TRDRNA2_/TRDRNA2_175328_c0~~gnl/TRDRNA2_/TRDRNA2_175328_c0_seq4.p1  ORF type:complete len:153 (-),score=15.24 gnl/TRDRNA2_/TRDRNA2_175328_c0_seq4:47-505(-)
MELCEAPDGEEQKDPSRHVLGQGDAARNGFCLAVLEFGAGLNVTTIRRKCESLLYLYPENCILARVNKDFPLVLDHDTRQHIEVMSGSLRFIAEVDQRLQGRHVSSTHAEAGASAAAKAKAKSKARGPSASRTLAAPATAPRSSSKARRSLN